MNIKNLFNTKKLVFSLEVFPPKVNSPVKTIYKCLNELRQLNPDFISVTYGAGGSLINNKTSEIKEESKKLFKPKYIYNSYNLNRKNNYLSLSGTNLILKGTDIRQLLNWT